VTARFRVFDGAEVGSWGLKCLGSIIYFLMGNLEVRGKKKINPTSMPVIDLIIRMNLNSSQTELV
jgi:hypothetical protein